MLVDSSVQYLKKNRKWKVSKEVSTQERKNEFHVRGEENKKNRSSQEAKSYLDEDAEEMKTTQKGKDDTRRRKKKEKFRAKSQTRQVTALKDTRRLESKESQPSDTEIKDTGQYRRN